ncbi:MAG TPA: c-type cytochrome [Acidimicrobiales bacterium]|nr:c-type cytochrome [Acidimicrobiales bacterium]
MLAARTCRVVAAGAGASLATVLAVLTGLGPAAAAEDGHDDPLGYVVDLEALDDPAVVAEGRRLYQRGCVSCHGVDGVGAPAGPPLRDAGAASAHFQLTSGRMPATVPAGAQPQRKPPAYGAEEITALVAYVASLGDGPEIPRVHPDEADVAVGGELFRQVCAACHSATGAGGAQSYGRIAPTLMESTPVQVAEAMRIGPGQMPVFGPERFSDEEVDEIVRYVQFLQEVGDPGGFALGRIGPIPEGFVAIVIGLGATLLAAFWVGKRREQSHDVEEGSA